MHVTANAALNAFAELLHKNDELHIHHNTTTPAFAACLVGLPLDCAQVPHVQEGNSRCALPADGL